MNATAYYHQKAQRSKYGATPEVVDGIRFHSRREAHRYRELLLLGLAGELHDLELQPRFPLLVNGVRVADYLADFRYQDRVRGDVVEDVKGFCTPVYRLKRRLVQAIYGISIEER
jgi:hypothetical protein